MNLLFSSIWQKEVWRINRSAKRLLIVTTNLDDFSVVNYRPFTNSPNFLPAKLSCYTVCLNAFHSTYMREKGSGIRAVYENPESRNE